MSKNTGTSELINYFDLGVNGDVGISGSLTLDTIANAVIDTDKFLVSDNGIIKYRTGAELLSDIGVAGSFVTIDTAQTITGIKTFSGTTLQLESSGSADATILRNTSGDTGSTTGFNTIGFNNVNNIFVSTQNRGGFILGFNNSVSNRTYTLPDASGTIALTSSIPANPVGGTGTTNYLPKFTGSTTIGDSIVSESGSLVSVIANSAGLRVTESGGADVRMVAGGSSGFFGTYSNHPLQFLTDSGTKMTLTSSGNLGLGVTPSAWSSPYKAFQFGATGVLWANATGTDWYLGNNEIYNSSNQLVYLTNGKATEYFQFDGQHVWRTAPSGTAGNAISFTQAMTLTSGGNLLVGTTTDNGARLQVSGASTFISFVEIAGDLRFNSNSTDRSIFFRGTAGSPDSNWKMGTYLNPTGATTVSLAATVIDVFGGAAGYGFMVRNTSNAPLLQIAGNTGAATFSSSVTIEGSGSQIRSGNELRFFRADNAIFTKMFDAGSTAANGFTFDNLNGEGFHFKNIGTTIMRMNSSGNVGIGTATPVAKLDVKGFTSITGNLELLAGGVGSGFNRQISIGSGTAYNYQIKADGDDFNIIEAGSTSRLRYDYGDVRWYITGGLTISGSLSKGSGSFKIDHPLPEKKDTHHLVHSFVEAPQADNIYRGKIDLVDGYAEVNIDEASGMSEGTFVLLNGNIQCFTSNEKGWTAIRGKVDGNILKVEAQDSKCTDTISWLVIGERIDQHMIDTDWTDQNGKVIVEPLKEQEKPSDILNKDLQNQNQTEDESNA